MSNISAEIDQRIFNVSSRDWRMVTITPPSELVRWFAVETTSRRRSVGGGANTRIAEAELLLRVWELAPVNAQPVLRAREIGSFGASYHHTEGQKYGSYKLTGGSMALSEQARGIKLGTYLQNEVTKWAMVGLGCPGLIESMDLLADDARTSSMRDRRNRFFEQFGLRFDWKPPVNGIAHAEGSLQYGQTIAELKPVHLIEGVRAIAIPNGMHALTQQLRQYNRKFKEREDYINELIDELGTMRERRRYIIALATGLGTAAFLLGAVFAHLVGL